jgi:hypothetical protein
MGFKILKVKIFFYFAAAVFVQHLSYISRNNKRVREKIKFMALLEKENDEKGVKFLAEIQEWYIGMTRGGNTFCLSKNIFFQI